MGWAVVCVNVRTSEGRLEVREREKDKPNVQVEENL